MVRHPDPPLVFGGSVVAMVLLAVMTPDPGWSGPWRLPGLAPVAFGWWLHAAAWRRFGSAGTTVRAGGRPSELVTDGPYSWTRNPMYLAGISILSGAAVLLGSASTLAVPVLYGAVAHRVFVREEERVMERRFGRAYGEYRSSVRPWL